MLLWNAFYVYKIHNPKEIYLNFRGSVILNLDKKMTVIDIIRKTKRNDLLDRNGEDLTVGHWPKKYLKPENGKRNVFYKCRNCTFNKKRKETYYYCSGCEQNPPLCPECNGEFHERKAESNFS